MQLSLSLNALFITLIPLASGLPAPISSGTPDPNAPPTLGVTLSGAGNDGLTAHGLTKRQTGRIEIH
jgi:hypothetical protein